MTSIGIAIICKTPEPGKSKTRLSPPLTPQQCAHISSCFIRDLTATIGALREKGDIRGYALYTPVGSEEQLRALLPQGFELIAQPEGDLGHRLLQGTRDILARGNRGAIIVNADSPTLPPALLRAAADALLDRDCMAISPAADGGYTFIGLTQADPRLFENVPWSTDVVHQLTLQRASECGLPVAEMPMWYDVDDRDTLAVLTRELQGTPPDFAGPHTGMPAAPATRAWLEAQGLLHPLAKSES